MPFSLIPDRVFQRYTDVTGEMLRGWDIRLLLCDLDYTLAPRSVSRPDDALLNWLRECEAAGVTVMILSNNRSSRRVDTFCRDLGICYVGHAGKPSCRGYREAMERVGVTKQHTAMLGDKLLTDMLAANRTGVLALMVEPVGGAVTAWQKVLHALQEPVKAVCRGRMAKNG